MTLIDSVRYNFHVNFTILKTKTAQLSDIHTFYEFVWHLKLFFYKYTIKNNKNLMK